MQKKMIGQKRPHFINYSLIFVILNLLTAAHNRMNIIIFRRKSFVKITATISKTLVVFKTLIDCLKVGS